MVFTGGATETQERRINVEAPPPNLPVITRFNANPPGQLAQGDCLDLYWDVQGAVDRVALVRNDAPLGITRRSAAPTDCTSDAGGYTYKLQAWGPGGGPVKRALGNQRPPEKPDLRPIPPRRIAWTAAANIPPNSEATAVSTESVCSRTTGNAKSGPC